jgi:hypothetical protein
VGVVLFVRHSDGARDGLRSSTLMDMPETRSRLTRPRGFQPELISVWQRWSEAESCLNIALDRKERARVEDRRGDHHRRRSDGG